jgi:site-specific recombinase XerD
MKLPDALASLDREQLMENHKSTTRETYRGWVRDYSKLLQTGVVADFQGYLDHIATVRRVSWKTRKQALNALVFFHRRVLKVEIPPNSLNIGIPTKGKRVPVYLTHQECLAVLSRLERINRLQCVLMYGCGLRVTECLTMRLKDIDLAGGMITVRSGKGNKDRTVRLPQSFYPMIEEQIHKCRRQFEKDKAAGLIFPIDDPALMRKLGRAQFKRISWYWLFPSRLTRGDERWHATTKGLETPLKDAAEAAGIMKRMSPHVWRHSYATNLLTSGVDIRTIQDQLGHASVETTEIYTHAVGYNGTESPLDKLGPPASGTIVHFPQQRFA